MHVHVHDVLPSGGPVGLHHVDASGRQSLVEDSADSPGSRHDCPRLRLGHAKQVVGVLLGDHQRVSSRRGVDVQEGNACLVLVQQPSLDLTADDATEDAVHERRILPVPGRELLRPVLERGVRHCSETISTRHTHPVKPLDPGQEREVAFVRSQRTAWVNVSPLHRVVAATAVVIALTLLAAGVAALAGSPWVIVALGAAALGRLTLLPHVLWPKRMLRANVRMRTPTAASMKRGDNNKSWPG